MPSYKLYAPEASFRAIAPLIASEYNNVEVDVSTDVEAASKLSPVGKLPLLELPNGSFVFSSHAIARYLAGIRSDTGLCGSSLADQAAVDAWIDFVAQHVELPACVLFYPVAGYMPFNEAAYKKAKSDLVKALQALETHLKEGKARLVGSSTTLADIVAVSTLLYPFKLVCDEKYLQSFPNVVRWFQDCAGQPEFQQVVGQVVLCKKEIMAPGQVAK